MSDPQTAPPDLRQTLEQALTEWTPETVRKLIEWPSQDHRTGQLYCPFCNRITEEPQDPTTHTRGCHRVAINAALEAFAYLLAAPAALEAKAEWQPIETAPKDGTTILIARNLDPFGWIRGYATWQNLSRLGGGWISHGFGVFGELGLAEPTHWQPLPPPPSREET